jgi:hypothetical protein
VAARQIKIYTVSLLLEDKLASIVTGTPDFAVSSSLDVGDYYFCRDHPDSR